MIRLCSVQFVFGMVLVLVSGASIYAFGPVDTSKAAEERPTTLEALGERLFFDVNLSANRTQSCGTCHDPSVAFTDPRGAASPGGDGESIGDRNAPTVTYASLTPTFGRNDEGDWRGGFFHDGRASSLADQAGGPPLNPIEMGMPNKEAVVARLKEDAVYLASFSKIFGDGVLDDVPTAYQAMTDAIAAFEKDESIFAPFDSRYDRFLRGEVKFTPKEELGRLLFFSQQFTNCHMCHQLSKSPIDLRETFSNYSFHNIGVPENTDLREINVAEPGSLDTGLAMNAAVGDDPHTVGQFKTPTLRNVAVTGPYMHNGVFEDLRTVVLFYNTYNTKSEARKINPETGEPFRPAQVLDTVSIEELTHGPALDDKRVDALVAFMKTLTDKRYEHLLEE